MLIFLPKAAVQMISLIISHGFNTFIAILGIKFGIDALIQGSYIFGAISLSVGLLVGGITVYFVRKSFLRVLQETRQAAENEPKDS